MTQFDLDELDRMTNRARMKSGTDDDRELWRRAYESASELDRYLDDQSDSNLKRILRRR